MRWLIFLGTISLLFVSGCERIKLGEPKVVSPQPTPPHKRIKPQKAELVSPETPPPTPSAAPETTATQMLQPITAQPTPIQPSAPQPAPELKVAQPMTPAARETTAFSFADEAYSVRASADALFSQFDRLSVSEIKSRLLLLNQAVSELEVRSPALVLWRTALRLEVMSKSAYPDISSAMAWIARARKFLSDQKAGLTALVKAETSLKAGNWENAVTSLKDAAARLKALEQAELLTQVRVCLLDALEALEGQKNSVAKAEVGEAVKALDRLITALP